MAQQLYTWDEFEPILINGRNYTFTYNIMIFEGKHKVTFGLQKCVSHKPGIQNNFETFHSTIFKLGTKKGSIDSYRVEY